MVRGHSGHIRIDPSEKMIHCERPFSFWNLVIVALCLCVFLFGTHARLVQYDSLTPNVNAVGQAKLWISDHRMEPQPVLSLLLLVIVAFRLVLSPSPVFHCLLLAGPAPVPVTLKWQLRRFFRPPPAL